MRRGTVADVLSPEEIRQMIREEARQGVILLNFSHPFTQEQIRQLEECVGRFVEFVCPDGRVDFDPESDFETQVRDLVDSLGFLPEEWEEPGRFIVSLPGFAEPAAVLLAELHGRMGHFPTIVRRKAAAESPVTAYHVAEVIDLAGVRARARRHRGYVVNR